MSTEEKWPELLDMMGSLGEKLDRIIGEASQKALPDYAAGIVLTETPQPVNLHSGYKFNYLLVSSEAASAMGSVNVLTVNTPGMIYTQPIYEGINPLNIKGSSAKLSVSGLSGQYVAQFVETNESPLVMSAGVVKLTGSLPPLGDIQPILVGTVPYSDFTAASASIYGYLPKVLTRNVRARTLIVTNTMDQSLTSVGFYPYDSGTAEGSPSGIEGGFTWNSGPGASGGVMTLTSEQASQGGAGTLATHVDSFQYGLGMGATLPTSGNVYIHIVEVH